MIVEMAIVGMCVMAGAGGLSDGMVVKSPDGRLSVSVGVDGTGQLVYRVDREGQAVVEASPLGVTVDGIPLGRGVAPGRAERWAVDETYVCRGVHSKARNRFNGVKIPIAHKPSGGTYTLEVRVFNDGVGLRYIVPGEGKHRVAGEDTAFILPEGCGVWFQTNTKNYEGIHERAAVGELKPNTFMGPPVVAELANDGGYVAITEAALFDYSGMTLRAVGESSRRLAAAFEDWIRPGRGFWHWWSGTMGNWDSVAYDRQAGWVDYASDFGFEYYLVDAGWEETWAKPGRDKWSLLGELTRYASDKKVGIWVWKRWKTGKTEGIEMEGLDDPASRREFFRRCKAAGVAGVKIDYMDSEAKAMVDFYTDVLKDAAVAQLMIDFHGANKPTGEPRRYPHEMTREGVRGLEYNKWSALPPSHYASLPFTRFVAGHGDFTPCTLNPEMLKGTTFALQLATAVCYTSPVMFYADKPEVYLKTQGVDVLKAIPSVWDETIVLPGSRIGKLAAIARRSGDKWFVGIINGGAARSYSLNLAFLGQAEYRSTQLVDTPQHADNLTRTDTTVHGGTTLAVAMNAGGGFVAVFELVTK